LYELVCTLLDGFGLSALLSYSLCGTLLTHTSLRGAFLLANLLIILVALHTSKLQVMNVPQAHLL
jgi:hypothetical protein